MGKLSIVLIVIFILFYSGRSQDLTIGYSAKHEHYMLSKQSGANTSTGIIIPLGFYFDVFLNPKAAVNSKILAMLSNWEAELGFKYFFVNNFYTNISSGFHMVKDFPYGKLSFGYFASNKYSVEFHIASPIWRKSYWNDNKYNYSLGMTLGIQLYPEIY